MQGFVWGAGDGEVGGGRHYRAKLVEACEVQCDTGDVSIGESGVIYIATEENGM